MTDSHMETEGSYESFVLRNAAGCSLVMTE